jgi:hypothetical protein
MNWSEARQDLCIEAKMRRGGDGLKSQEQEDHASVHYWPEALGTITHSDESLGIA